MQDCWVISTSWSQIITAELPFPLCSVRDWFPGPTYTQLMVTSPTCNFKKKGILWYKDRTQGLQYWVKSKLRSSGHISCHLYSPEWLLLTTGQRHDWPLIHLSDRVLESLHSAQQDRLQQGHWEPQNGLGRAWSGTKFMPRFGEISTIEWKQILG